MDDVVDGSAQSSILFWFRHRLPTPMFPSVCLTRRRGRGVPVAPYSISLFGIVLISSRLLGFIVLVGEAIYYIKTFHKNGVVIFSFVKFLGEKQVNIKTLLEHHGGQLVVCFSTSTSCM